MYCFFAHAALTALDVAGAKHTSSDKTGWRHYRSCGGGMVMPTPAELRENARLYRQSALEEPEPELKIRLASHALALAQLAEAMERADADGISLRRRAS